MKKLKNVKSTNKYCIKSSIDLTAQDLTKVMTLLTNCLVNSNLNGAACKRMRCSNEWLMLRMGIALRVLIHRSTSKPRDVWVIQRSELAQACKTLKAHT